MRGKFIVVEGPDLCGKSTQVPMLVDYLNKNGVSAVKLATPCRGTPVGNILDSHLKGQIWMTNGLDQGLSIMDHGFVTRAREDALSFQSIMAADKYVASSKIVEYLEAGVTVITDRWWQSAVVYGASDSVDPQLLIRMNAFLPKADINLLFKISLGEFKARLEKRPEKKDRYDTPEKFVVISDLYSKLWVDMNDGTWMDTVVNDSVDNVQSQLRNLISDYFPDFKL